MKNTKKSLLILLLIFLGNSSFARVKSVLGIIKLIASDTVTAQLCDGEEARIGIQEIKGLPKLDKTKNNLATLNKMVGGKNIVLEYSQRDYLGNVCGAVVLKCKELKLTIIGCIKKIWLSPNFLTKKLWNTKTPNLANSTHKTAQLQKKLIAKKMKAVEIKGAVYITAHSNYYHSYNCEKIKNKKCTVLTNHDAEFRGYKPCPDCYKNQKGNPKKAAKNSNSNLII